ncbi:MAG: DNA replication/repair protein RecF [Actinomycetota bacterium]|nr:DNA replication/repair protein RecF [Actinomycetota bacterium]
MIVEELALQDFRNYERARLDLGAGVTLVTGRNAQGKTNLLEAIHCLSGLGSPRTTEPVLVREGAEKGYVHGRVRRGERRVEIDLEIQPGRKTRALLNKTPVPGAKALGEVVVAVFFGPDDLALVKGSPEGRRRFLDDLAVKARPASDGLRREWERVLRQRNSLLKTAPRSSGGPPKTLEVWDEAFCRAGAAISAARLRILAALVPPASVRFESISGGDRLALGYESSWLDSALADKALEAPDTIDEGELHQSLRSALESVRVRELERGLSLIGPQRDDVAIRLDGAGGPAGRDARSHASQGEQRSAALSLKLGEFDLLENVLRDDPILLLDDVFSELDPARRQWLADAVRGKAQTIMSSAEGGAVEAARADRVFEVVAGKVTPRA